MKKVFNIIFKIFMILYVVFISLYLLFIIMQRVSINHSIFGYRIYNVCDNTMKKYKINDIVLVKDIKTKKIKKNNIIAYYGEFNNDVVLHKVIEVKKDKELSFVTKGDNNQYNDPIVKDKKVIGKVVCVIPVVNVLHHILKNQIGFFLIVFLPLLVLVIIQLIRTVMDINSDKQKFVFEQINTNKKKKSVVKRDNGEIEVIKEKIKNIKKNKSIKEATGPIIISSREKKSKNDSVKEATGPIIISSREKKSKKVNENTEPIIIKSKEKKSKKNKKDEEPVIIKSKDKKVDEEII